MAMDANQPPDQPLSSREPSVEDVVDLCRSLNLEQAKYIIIGGFAMRAAGYDRRTMDVDLLIETGAANEQKVFRALEILPDQAVKELSPGEVAQYSVVRIADEIVIDLMKSAAGIEYAEAEADTVVLEVDGVRIPFASPKLLWKMKCNTHREKDAADVFFLKRLLENAPS